MRQRRTRRASGTLLVAALMGLTLALAVQLAYQTQNAVRRHRRTAEGVLRDYARLAANEYTRRCGNQLDYYAMQPALAPIGAALSAGGPLPIPGPVSVWDGPGRERPVVIARTHFRVDLERGTLVQTGDVLAPAVASWVADTLAALARRDRRRDVERALVFGGRGDCRTLGVVWERDASGVAQYAYGLEARPAAVRHFLRQAERIQPLLPRTLGGGSDSLVSVHVATASGCEMYRSEIEYASPFAAADTLGPRLGALVCTASLRPQGASALVIGGLPGSRARALLVLLGLTALVLAATLFLLRREQELARVRTDFVSSVSHELRTPLAQIRLFTETLLLGRVRSDAEARRSLEIVDQEARRLTHLVENVLHVSRAERHALRIAPEATALAPLVQNVVAGFAPLVAGRNVDLQVDVQGDLGARVDPDAVRQMLLNLLDNAVKYGPEGQTVRVRAALADGDRLRIEVDDAGPGIPARDRDRIWDRFWRARGRPQDGTPGAGIGLAVVRELVALHGGRAWVEDAPGGGARFVIELPGGYRLPASAARVAPVEEGTRWRAS